MKQEVKAVLYDISDVCAMFDLTPSGLRYYEQVGLIHPMRTDSGRRKYGEEEMRRLFHIKTLRSYNLSLEEIGAFFMNNTSVTGTEISDLLQMHIWKMEMQIATLRASQNALHEYSSQLSESRSGPEPVKEVTFPEYCVLKLNPLFGRSRKEWNALSEWFALIPSVRRGIHYSLHMGQTVTQDDGFFVDKKSAESSHLPLLENALSFPGGRGLRLCYPCQHNTVHGLEEKDIVLLDRLAKKHGLQNDLNMFASYLFGNMDGQIRQKWYDIWIIETKS